MSTLDRRKFVQTASLAAGFLSAAQQIPGSENEPSGTASEAEHPVYPPLLTPDRDFNDVSRGDPKPHTLTGKAVEDARLTETTWRCEITADPFVEEPHTKVPAKLERELTIAQGTALDLATLKEMGKKHEVHFLKAMQCLNIDLPLGQGLWTGVPLRDVLSLCGKMENVRRIYYWGFHNNDPKQVFQSSVSYTQCMETAPGDLPVFLAYQVQGEPISLQRGGPVRMIVPWSHGYKSIKWLHHIFVTNDPRNNDTYANGNNDPDSYLKTAAYLDKAIEGKVYSSTQSIFLTGQVISGLSGVDRVEYWLRKVESGTPPIRDDSSELLEAPWELGRLEPIPDWDAVLPAGRTSRQILGFDRESGKPKSWPTRYGMCSFSIHLQDLQPGMYEIRARAVDLNGFAQPQPRPSQKSGKNAIPIRRFEVR